MELSYFLPAFSRISVYILVASTILSCGEDSGQNTPSENGTIKLNCTILKRAQIQQWVDSGWTKPANKDRIKVLLLQSMIPHSLTMFKSNQVACTPGKDYLDTRPAGRVVLTVDTTCVPLTLIGPTIFSNAYIGFKLLEITNPDGTLKVFDFVRFRPVKKHLPFISYEIEIVMPSGNNKKLDETADPCPHYCPPIQAD